MNMLGDSPNYDLALLLAQPSITQNDLHEDVFTISF